ncbi:MAG: PA4642 family protein [Gammaproteobacteria bacterium]|nr:PA4642 family protein [Gammaproteobacteria bacterium]
MSTEKKTGANRTQPAVRDEWWSDERVKSFLALESSQDETPDFHILQKAYRGMVPEAFSRFISFFIEEGKNLNERNKQGETLLQIVSAHRNSEEYAEILKAAGAE